MNYWLWLANIRGIGSIKKQKLLEKFERNPEKIFKASKNELLQIEGIGYKSCEIILNDNRNIDLINKMEIYMKRNEIRQLDFYDKEYPLSLKKIYDPPITLFYKGNIKLINDNCISVVGSRNASDYGIKMSYKIGQEFGKNNFVVVSGMARGIDTSAHKGALIVNGKTIAVVRLRA